jgi:YbbR domain-containing protein
MRVARVVLSNLATLLLSILLATVVWAVAVQTSDPVEVRNLELPVRVEGRAADTSVVGQPPAAVLISIRGPVSALNEVTPADFTAFIDVSDLPYGDVEAPIQVQLDGSIADRLEVLLVLPNTAQFRLEQIITRGIPIELDMRGEVARGHRVHEARVEPSEVQVTGSAQRVEQIAEGRVTVFLDNARADINQTLRPVFYDVQGNVLGVSNLTLDPADVELVIDIVELAGFAEKPISVEWVGEPAAGYRLLNITVEPASIQVTGAPSRLENLRVSTEQIDISGLTESETMQVVLDLPLGISLVEIQPIVVTVEVEPILTSDVVQKTVEVRGLASDLEAELDPEEVRVFLFGPLPVLDFLEEDDVRVTVDLLGLGIGEHLVEPIVTVTANDVDVRSTQPPVITVVISEVVTSTAGTVEMTGFGPLSGQDTQTGPAELGTPFLASRGLGWLGLHSSKAFLSDWPRAI